MPKDNHRKQVAFDLDTNELKRYYPTDNWRKSYEDIKKHMIKFGFEWQQGSVYVSQYGVEGKEVYKIIEKFVNTNEWINKCMRDCKITSIGKDNNLNYLFDKDIEIPERNSLVENKNEKEHIKELKRNGFQPTRGIIAMMKKIDQEYGCYVDMATIRDIYKEKSKAPSEEARQCCNKIGQECRSQELSKVRFK